MPTFGVYPVADAEAVGEVSSTYEGRHVTLIENEITHPTHADGFVDQYDPVVVGAQMVGIALKSAAAATDPIAIDTEGIWKVDVVAVDDAGNSAVAGGDLLYINTTTAVVSKISNGATQIPFGIALGIITGGNTERIAVKVHYDPSLQNDQRKFYTVTSGAYSYGFRQTGILAAGESTGVGGYVDAQVSGAQTGGIYGWGCWVEPQANFVGAGLLVATEGGIYDGAGANISANTIVMHQMQAILAGAPANLYPFRINVAAAGGAITAIFAAANPTSLAYSAGTAGTGVVGTIPFANIVGPGLVYINVHAAVI